MEWSEAQKLAVETVGKNVCVSAGAGSGKTSVLVERFLHLVKHHQISPANILAITFTEKAANEMKRRIVKRLREENLETARREVENAAIGTIHSFAARLLREHPVEAGVDPHFAILEAAEAEALQERVLDETMDSAAEDPEIFNLLMQYGEESVRKGILGTYRSSRNSETSYEEILRRRAPAGRKSFESDLQKELKELSAVKGALEAGEELERLSRIPEINQPLIDSVAALKGKLRAAGNQKKKIQQVQEMLLDFSAFLREEKNLTLREVFIRLALEFEKRYEAAKREEGALDFDDLQLRAVRLLGSDTPASRAAREIYREKYREILVDEFQDTNYLQDRLIELIRREANLFLVGDLKQSIYAFRGTRVEIFIEKEKNFSASQQGARISLSENYRSLPSVIDFVNPFFEALWKEDGIPFERLQAVRPPAGEGFGIERLELEERKDETTDDLRLREARSLAERIRSLVDRKEFAYKDIACLFEAMSDVHFYEQEFRRLDIPHFVVSNRGFYSQPEIRDVLSFLSCLENPRRDIPLAAALRSPLFRVSDETLFRLARHAKAKNAEVPLLAGVREFDLISEIPAPEKARLQFFKETFEYFLEEKEKARISILIEKVLRFTDYDLYVLKSRQSGRAHANLRKLVEVAREMESKEPIHLGDFIRAVRGLEMREVRVSQAQVEAEEGNTVKLMSIHMAKGLEFPVTVLADLGRHEKAEGGNFLATEAGFGIRVPEGKPFDFEETFTFRINKRKISRVRSEESKRLLYVAMTRAKDKLILSGPKPGKPAGTDSFHEMATWAHWVDRILSVGAWPVLSIPEVPSGPFPFERKKALAERKSIRSKLENLIPIPLRTPVEGMDALLQNLAPPERVYFERLDLPVSAFLLFARDPEAYFRVYEIGVPPDFELKNEEIREEETLSRAEFGTLVHQILEQVLVRRFKGRETEGLISRFTEGLSAKEREEILSIVRGFIGSEQAREIRKAKTFHAELPFALRLPYGIIQGTMDLVYQDVKGDWFILDYKTSDVDSNSFAVRGEEYRTQLELYALALWKILGVGPKCALIHFLRPGLTHRIPLRPDGFDELLKKFTELQKSILAFRKSKLQPVT